jgi:murein DD-endopeptidase MepM/ murein hydrolase activator NlpD
MIAPAERPRSRAVSHIGFAALIAATTAGCSGDVGRFNDSFGSPYASTRNAAPGPVDRVETQPLPPPPPGPGRSEVTGSLPPSSPAGQSSWHWEGGTAITVNPGDTIDSIAYRYRVPPHAIMQANNITAPASIQPGQRLVIPRYDQNGRPSRMASTAPRVASNATMVPARPQAQAAPMARSAPPAGHAVHVVGRGENLISIARLYHKPRKLIAKANHIAPDAKLRIGQHLTIPGAKPVPSQVVAAPTPAKPIAAVPAPQRNADAAAAKGQSVAPPPAPSTKGKVAALGPTANARVAAPAAEPGSTGSPAETTGSAPSFRWPVRGRIIMGFGPKTNGQHNDGINLAVPEGTSVKAAEDGVVAYAGNELKGYGNLILVRHSNGFVTAYAHASELMVKRGDQVKRGQVIARSGQTGTVSSPQLHFEIRKGASPVDPTQYLSGT